MPLSNQVNRAASQIHEKALRGTSHPSSVEANLRSSVPHPTVVFLGDARSQGSLAAVAEGTGKAWV